MVRHFCIISIFMGPATHTTITRASVYLIKFAPIMAGLGLDYLFCFILFHTSAPMQCRSCYLNVPLRSVNSPGALYTRDHRARRVNYKSGNPFDIGPFCVIFHHNLASPSSPSPRKIPQPCPPPRSASVSRFPRTHDLISRDRT